MQPNGLYRTDALCLLERLDAEQIMLAYIDAPWGAEPVNDDDVADVETEKELLSFLYRVFQHIRRVLDPSGNVFVHTGGRNSNKTRLVLDQIFGVKHHRADIIWPHARLPFKQDSIIRGHDTILCYSKAIYSLYNPQYRPLSRDDGKHIFSGRDENGLFKRVDMTTGVSLGDRIYTWKGVNPPAGRSWKYTRTRMEELDREGRLDYGENGQPRLKIYLSEQARTPISTLWDDIAPLRSADRGDLQSMQEKPMALLQRIIEIGSNRGDTILDPFCGTGTTLVAAQKVGRSWIGGDVSAEAFAASLHRLKVESSTAWRINPAIGVDLRLKSHGKRRTLKCLDGSHKPPAYLSQRVLAYYPNRILSRRINPRLRQTTL